MPPDSDPPGAAVPAATPSVPPPAVSTAPEETFRLHRLTPIALGGKILGIVAALFLLSLAEHQSASGIPWPTLAVYGLLMVVLVGRGVITVGVTRYHLLGSEFRIDSGLFEKQSKRIRLDRVQSVDVLQPLAARVFGLAEVKITTAGSERAAIRLRYLALPVAQSLRADLLGRSTGFGEGAKEAPERLVLAVPHGQLVGSVLLQMVSWRLIFLAIGPALAVLGNSNGHGATAGIGIGIFVWFAVLIVHAIWQRMNSLWDFTVTDAVDGLRVRHGLLSTSRQTVPPGRVQAVLIHQPLFWRPFGWAQVRMNVAGYGGADSSKRTMLVPVADRDYVNRLVGWIFGGVDLGTIPLQRPPRRAALRAPLWWRAQLAGGDDRVFVARHGLLSRTTDVVPHERTQSVRLTAGPVERALGLASVHLDSTRGPVKTRAAHRDATEARAMVDLEVERARSARRRDIAGQGIDPRTTPTAVDAPAATPAPASAAAGSGTGRMA